MACGDHPSDLQGSACGGKTLLTGRHVRAGRATRRGLIGPWFTSRMPRTVADILRDVLADADRRGIRSPTLDRLSNSDVQLLAAQTLAFLRTRPSSESQIPGWRQVGSFDAGVNRWWNEQIDSPILSDTAARLRKLGCVNSTWPHYDGLKWPHRAVVGCGRGRVGSCWSRSR